MGGRAGFGHAIRRYHVYIPTNTLIFDVFNHHRMIADVILPPVFSVADAMVLCGLTEAEAARVALEVFNDDFSTTMVL